MAHLLTINCLDTQANRNMFKGWVAYDAKLSNFGDTLVVELHRTNVGLKQTKRILGETLKGMCYAAFNHVNGSFINCTDVIADQYGNSMKACL